jgi:N-formylglutamate amidohydrolase
MPNHSRFRQCRGALTAQAREATLILMDHGADSQARMLMDGDAGPVAMPASESAWPARHRASDVNVGSPAFGQPPAPFVVIEPMDRVAGVVFASPHSGRCYPAELLAASRIDPFTLRRSEDVAVDTLFSAAPAAGAPLIAAGYARAWIDLNRDMEEIDPSMFRDPPPSHHFRKTARVAAGLGVVARVVGDGVEIYARKLRFEEAVERIEQIWNPYHRAIEGLLIDASARFGHALLVDCHSMPSAARGTEGIDIVIGDRFGHACAPAISSFVERSLAVLGYRVARNTPYAGGYSTQLHGRPHARRHAIQIEINRAAYLDERTLEPGPDFARVQADMATFSRQLIGAMRDGLAGS